jgi:hypothetical protein
MEGLGLFAAGRPGEFGSVAMVVLDPMEQRERGAAGMAAI